MLKKNEIMKKNKVVSLSLKPLRHFGKRKYANFYNVNHFPESRGCRRLK